MGIPAHTSCCTGTAALDLCSATHSYYPHAAVKDETKILIKVKQYEKSVSRLQGVQLRCSRAPRDYVEGPSFPTASSSGQRGSRVGRPAVACASNTAFA